MTRIEALPGPDPAAMARGQTADAGSASAAGVDLRGLSLERVRRRLAGELRRRGLAVALLDEPWSGIRDFRPHLDVGG